MSVISLASFKGGVSKTTCAIHIAALLDGKTLVIDSDPNRSASAWSRPGQLPFKVCGEKESAKQLRDEPFDNIVIDTPARPDTNELQELARGCDLLIVPTTPDMLSMDAMLLMIQTLPKKCNWRVLLTMVPPRNQRDGEAARQILKEKKIPVFSHGIRYAKAYKDAAAQGVTVEKVRRGHLIWRDWKELRRELLIALG